MDIQLLKHSIESYLADPTEDANIILRFQSILQQSPECFYRALFSPGHFTASALLIHADGKRVLLNHHHSLNKWLCFGGHADGNPDMHEVAHRELVEESGIIAVSPVAETIFDLDIHPIPENLKKGEPEHFHYDVRYLFMTNVEDFLCSEESQDLRWCNFEEAITLAGSSGMHRLLQKWHRSYS